MSAPTPFTPTEIQRRLRRLQAAQRRQRLDALLVTTAINRFYFTGLETSNGVLLSERGAAPAFYTDFRYLTMARRAAAWLPSHLLWRPSQEQEVVAGMGCGWRRVGYEGAMPASRFLKLQAALPDVEWIDATDLIQALRAVKSSEEQRRMRAAIAENDRLLAETLRQAAPGMREWEIGAVMRREAERLGQGESFPAIVCAGRNAAECHHQPGDAVLRRGQPLLLDLGLKLDHACADMTRCVSFGPPTPLWREIYRIVLEANRAAVRAIRPGVPCQAIDAVARGVIERAGYGACFGHSLGHGLGLEVHEAPSFSVACTTGLAPGMVLTVEPGIYVPGRLGIRIEDVVLVTRDGCEVLTGTPRELEWAIR
ncbi:MAG TPA: Xaa-Pro peptidase family protein [Kiritimatiellia bacterium]|nr:Xaa-Pro peptidase family protein [Kiritimatiellia bacterium]HRU70239.1 Xaa-Pro peptidase family protein [Kiritimatiellia bacterium]